MSVSRRMRDGLRSRRMQAVVVNVDRPPGREELDIMFRHARRLGVRILLRPPAGGKP